MDFIGFVQGSAVVFDAKETALNILPFKNIHEHQLEYMQEVDFHGGLAFLIAHFKQANEYHLIPYEILNNLPEHFEDILKDTLKTMDIKYNKNDDRIILK